MTMRLASSAVLGLIASAALSTAYAAEQSIHSGVKPLAGKAALVTGGARNLGRGYAVGLADHGADVLVHYHQADDRADAEETARLIRAKGVRAAIIEGDLCELAAIARVFNAATKAFGHIDIVVNNAGRMVKKPIVEITEQEFDSAFCMNAKGTFFMMQEAARRIADNGRIINIGTSILGSVAPNYSIYAGSKAPIEHFTRALAREIGNRGVTVNVIAPGPIDTPFYRSPESLEAIAYATNLAVARRLGRIDDIVPLVQFLASPGSQWITAQTIFINGGYTAR